MESARLAIPCCWILAASMAPGIAHPDLLTNGDFDSDIVPWVDPFPDPDTVLSWSPLDARESPSSGSLQIQTNISNGADGGAQGECIPAAPGVYSLSARVFVESGEGEQPFALLHLVFYDDPTCIFGSLLESASAFSSVRDVWEPIVVEAATPVATEAVRVLLHVGNTTDSVADVARFDEVRLVPEPPGSGAAAALVIAGLLASGRAARQKRASP